jgi:hypothetical protein
VTAMKPPPSIPHRTRHLAAAPLHASPTRRRRGAVTWTAPAALAMSAVVWAGALLAADVAHPSLYGMTVTLGPLYIAAVLLNSFAFAAELYGAGRSWVLASSVGLLIAIMKATVPLLERNPEYPWTYKHLGVVDVLATNGHIVDGRDIYQQWPSMFALFASLQTVAGVTPERVAAWSSVGFSVIDVVILYACFRKLGATPRVAYAGLFLFQIFAWPDLNYFSPQAFAFALCLGILLVLITCLLGRAPGGPPRWNPFARWLDRRLEPDRAPVTAPASRARTAGVVLSLCATFAVLTAAHQLSPYVILAEVVGLTLFDLVRPRWLIVVLAVIAVGYFLPQAGSVTSQFKIFDGFDIFSNASGNAVANVPGSGEERVSALCARFLSLALWGVGLLIVLARRRSLGRLAIPAILGLSPFAILVLGNYGGEAIYRVILFSSPWFAYLLAQLAGRIPARAWLGVAGSVLVLAATTFISLQSQQGQFALNSMDSAQVQASAYFYAHAPTGSSMTLLVQNFPARVSGDYNNFNQQFTTEPTLLPDPQLTDRTLNAALLPTVATKVRANGGTHQFLVVSQGMKPFVEYWGLLAPAGIDTFESALKASSAWTVWYSNSDTEIFELETAA